MALVILPSPLPPPPLSAKLHSAASSQLWAQPARPLRHDALLLHTKKPFDQTPSLPLPSPTPPSSRGPLSRHCCSPLQPKVGLNAFNCEPQNNGLQTSAAAQHLRAVGSEQEATAAGYRPFSAAIKSSTLSPAPAAEPPEAEEEEAEDACGADRSNA